MSDTTNHNPDPCPLCAGTGKVLNGPSDPDSMMGCWEEECPRCHGTKRAGYVYRHSVWTEWIRKQGNSGDTP